jgi:hypothetical protein
MQVSNTEFGTFDMDWQINLATTTQILDIAISALLWPARYGSSALLADFFFDIVSTGANMNALRLWWKSHNTIHMRASANQLTLTLVPYL